EDLFDRNRLIPVPRPPLRIGLVASPGTEGHADFMGSLEASGMAFTVLLVPTQVQGREAATSVASAIVRLGSTHPDLIVVVRGGGSKADLATFDAEPVARAIAAADTPVWTGIGHTGDQSVADEVANHSFITPTECGQALAHLATDVWQRGLEAGLVAGRLAHDLLAQSERSLDRRRRGMATGTRSQLDRHADAVVHKARTLRGAVRAQVDAHGRDVTARGGLLARAAVRTLDSHESTVRSCTQRLTSLPARRLQAEDLRVAQWRRLLGAYDYRRQLERGYSVTRDESGRVVRSVSGLGAGDQLRTRLADGEVMSIVSTDGDGTDETSERQDQHDHEGMQ
ncbi:MAG TPA: exodeoxyribonuclease VII large subunit, partial [Acidimicrobiales bacterium]|nr:exodeoxyribonuclease VII large subunit [Acidimicrobiales bacterium]